MVGYLVEPLGIWKQWFPRKLKSELNIAQLYLTIFANVNRGVLSMAQRCLYIWFYLADGTVAKIFEPAQIPINRIMYENVVFMYSGILLFRHFEVWNVTRRKMDGIEYYHLKYKSQIQMLHVFYAEFVWGFVHVYIYLYAKLEGRDYMNTMKVEGQLL